MSSDHDTIFTETIARHFDSAQIDGNQVDLGIAGLHIDCRVNSIREIGDTRSASLFMYLWGGGLGEIPVFASTSGYGASAEEAIVTGACNWACAFGPVLEAALGGKTASDADCFDVKIHGRSYQAVGTGLDRAMFYGGDETGDIAETTRAARTHLGADPWLVSRVIESKTLPALPLHHAVVVSVFCWESADRRTLEVKVNGCDWLPSGGILNDMPPFQGAGAALLRELFVLVPKDEAPRLSRKLLEATLGGAAKRDESEGLSAWHGWRAHGGVLGEPTNELALKRLEAKIGALPTDYRSFLLEVQATGAGPGYGLISPFSRSQHAMAAGRFEWLDGEEPETEPAGVLALAHAGCGVMWLLVVSGPKRGEVWLDGRGSDAIARRVAPSFLAWLHDWIDMLVRDNGAFYQWEAKCCATPSVISQFIEALEAEGLEGDDAIAALPARLPPGAIGLASGGGVYFETGDALDPCEPCSKLVTRFAIDQAVFKPGVIPKQARTTKGGILGRVFGRKPT